VLDVEVAKPALPEYTAAMLYEPEARLLVENVATPKELAVLAPSNVVPL
jgi:hypothetical protein